MTLLLSLRQQRLLTNASDTMLAPCASANEADWYRAVMAALMPLTGAYKSAIRVAEPGGFRMTPLGFEQAAIEEHQAYYHRFDFGRALGQRPVLSEVFSSNEYYGRDLPRWQGTEYYCDYISKYAVFDALCLSTRADEHEKGVVLYLWHERELAADKRRAALAVLRLLVPSFRAGIRFGANVHCHRHDLLATFDASSDGFALFSHTGVLLHRNPALALILAEADDQTGLSKAIVTCALAVRDANIRHRGSPESMAGGTALHHVGSAAYAVAACILDVASSDSPSILVMVTRRGQRRLASNEVDGLRERYALTGRELEVAILLRSRQTNQEIASRLGVSEHTARHHTENVLRKLGVTSRTEIVRVMAEIAARPPSEGERSVER